MVNETQKQNNIDNPRRIIVSKIAGPEMSTDPTGTTVEGDVVAVAIAGGAAAESGDANILSATLLMAVFTGTGVGCYVSVGTGPTAQAADFPIVANMPYLIQKKAGSDISVISMDANTGNLHLHPAE